MRAALDCSIRGQFDFSDLPPEVQDRKERMARIRELRDRVMAMHLDHVEPAELWRLLGGSPHLSLEEKAKVVDELPALGAARRREVYGKLKRAEKLLEQMFQNGVGDMARLYEALRTGEMADVYDVEGALATASRWQCGWLPTMAIASRADPWCAPEKISEDELKIAEKALRSLASEPGYEAVAWNGLGHLLMDHLGRYEEAEKAYCRAIEFDPQSPYPWGNLASLLERDSERQGEAMADFFKAAERDPMNDLRRREALRIARSAGAGPHSDAALERVSRLQDQFPEDRYARFVLAGLLTLSGEWTRARVLLAELAASEVEQPDVWAFGAAVKAGHADDVVALFEQTGAHERWRPLYEALKAVQAGSTDYLRRVAPEIRTIAEQILNQIAPDLK
jgi:tetratricopeptide (TPR) repeat protein